MITDFKKKLYCELAGIKQRDVDANDPIWVARINGFLANRTPLPPPDDPSEYARMFEAVYPDPEQRRLYIEKAILKGRPSLGHRVLASLLSQRLTPCVFTTNFDRLVENATTVTDQLLDAANPSPLTVAALDTADRAVQALKEVRWPLLVKLHGDFQSVELKNTTDELKAQDAKLRRQLAVASQLFGFVFVGYSGRDDSVMAALDEALAAPGAFPAGLFWVARDRTSLLPAVQAFLDAAEAKGIATHIVECLAFDELAGTIADGLDLPPKLEAHVFTDAKKVMCERINPPREEHRNFPVLQCSALPIKELPTVARRLRVAQPVSVFQARELVKAANIWAVVANAGSELAAFGNDEELLRAFAPVGGQLAGTIALQPATDSWAHGLLYEALARALCRHRPLTAKLLSRGHVILVRGDKPTDAPERRHLRRLELMGLKNAYSGTLTGTVPNLGYSFSEGIEIRLECLDEHWWCAFDPFTHVVLPRGDEADEPAPADGGPFAAFKSSTADDWRRERWANRRNGFWASIIKNWGLMLAGDAEAPLCALGVAADAGVDARFRLSPIPAWSRPSHDHALFLRPSR